MSEQLRNYYPVNYIPPFPGVSRREFLGCLGAGVAGCVLADTLAGAAPVGEELHEASFYEPLAEGCRFVYIGNVPGEEAKNTVCPHCQAVLIRRYEYRILENNIVKGACKACGKTIPGVWE